MEEKRFSDKFQGVSLHFALPHTSPSHPWGLPWSRGFVGKGGGDTPNVARRFVGLVARGAVARGESVDRLPPARYTE